MAVTGSSGGSPRWWAVRRASNRKPATYRCPICGRHLHAMSDHVLIAPEGDSSHRRHAQVHGELPEESRPRDFVQLCLKHGVSCIRIDSELDREVPLGLGKAADVGHRATLSGPVLPAFGGFLHGLTSLIEKPPDPLGDAGNGRDRAGHEILPFRALATGKILAAGLGRASS